MRVRISPASPAGRIACRTAVWSSAPSNPAGNDSGPRARRSAPGLCAGPWPKPPSSACGRTNPARSTLRNWHTHGKATALTGLAHKRARAVYYMLTREHAFDLKRFVTASPLRGEPAPAVSRADHGQSLHEAPSLSTAPTVLEPLDQRPGALGVEWTVPPAHSLGDASPSLPWLPRPRV